jgi:signal transduction histidine kinase
LRELIRNVVENALRHARTRITIRCAVEGDRALLQIADDGLGVDVSDRERIFERFFRADGDARGSGLGLAIAQWVARAHDGLLVLDDVPSGASFTARIPLLR